MGQLYYGTAGVYDFDDRALVHLRSIIVSKLSRQESFVLSWADGNAQHSIWMHPSMHLVITIDNDADHELNHAWLAQLAELANAPSGLRMVPEPTEAE